LQAVYHHSFNPAKFSGLDWKTLQNVRNDHRMEWEQEAGLKK